MRLSRIRFANYRQIPDFELDVHRHLVLVGPNDAGKSSVLNGLNLLLGTYGSQLSSAISSTDFTDPAKEVVIEARLVDLDDDEKAAFPDEVSVVAGDEFLRIRLEMSMSDADDGLVQIARTFPDSGLGRGLSVEQLRVIGWEHVPATRSLHRELGGSQSGVMRSLLGRIDLGDDMQNVLNAFEQLSAVLDGSNSLGEFRRQLAEALSEALPTDLDKDAVRILLPNDLSDNPLTGAQIGLDSGSAARSLNEQSDGVRALAVMAAYGIAHFGANIISIDEPEMHLHPTAQRLVARLLSSGSAQTLLATHSSHVTSQFAPEEVAAFRPGTGVSRLGAGAEASGFFFAARWWQDQFVEPLTARVLVVVEGTCERMVVNAVADTLGLSLHRHGVHVFDLGGAAQFKNANIAFGAPGFGIRVMGLVDEDHRINWAGVLGCDPTQLEARGYRVCDPDLEGEIVQCLGPERVIELLDASVLFEEAAILQSIGVTRRADAGTADVVTVMKAGKAPAAAALSSTLTANDAQKLTPIVELLAEAIK